MIYDVTIYGAIQTEKLCVWTSTGSSEPIRFGNLIQKQRQGGRNYKDFLTRNGIEITCRDK